MTLSAAVSGDITDKELKVINYLFTTLPVFENSNNDHLSKKIIESMEVIKSEPNVENIVDLIGDSLEENSNLKKTAYILAIEIMMADLEVSEESYRLLELFENSFPAYVSLSIFKTSIFKSLTKCFATFDPMKPEPPVKITL